MPRLAPYTLRTQGLFCLLFILNEMPIGCPRKREVIEYIQRRGYLDIKPSDVEPYMSQVEPRWNTDVARRRQDAVERDLLFNQIRDGWEITRAGKEKFQKAIEDAKTRVFDVRKCPLWTKYLKKAFDPNYIPSEEDAVRKPKRSELLALYN
jgi:hypothetical protein